MNKIKLLPKADEDLTFWKKSGNKKILKRIGALVDRIQKSPFEGIGKPEGLKYDFTGLWSRRITESDRLIYEVEEDVIYIHSLRGHYESS